MKQLFQLIGKSRGLQTLLILSFLITGLTVAYAVHRNQSNEKALESALEDKVSFASWVYSTTAGESLKRSAYRTLRTVLESVEENNGQLFINLNLPNYNRDSIGTGETECDRNYLKPVESVFVYDTESRKIDLRSVDEAGAAEFKQWLSDEIEAAALAKGELHKKLYANEQGEEYLAVMVRSPGLSPLNKELVLGAKTRVKNLDDLFGEIWRKEEIMPASVTGDQAAGKLMAMEIRTQTGSRIYSSGNPSDKKISIKANLGKDLDVFRSTMAISNPENLHFMSSGLHGESNIILIVLFTIAAGLGVVAFVQFKNEMKLVSMKRDFISNVSHELRTPVTQIRMFAETLLNRRTRSQGEVKKSLKIIEKESQRLSRLISNLLNYTAKDRQVVTTSIETIQVDEEVEEVVQAFKPQADSASVTFKLDLEPVMAELDPSCFKQILINVIDNAVKYGPDGQQIDIRLRKNGTNVELSIADEGPGIPQEIQQNVWEPKWRQDNLSGDSKTGIGIGLSVVKQYLEQMNGKAEVHNRKSNGVEFKFILPLNQRGDHYDEEDG